LPSPVFTLPRRVWRKTVCAAGPRCSPPGTVLSRAHIYGYGRSLRPPQGTSIAPRRRAGSRQTLLARARVQAGRDLLDCFALGDAHACHRSFLLVRFSGPRGNVEREVLVAAVCTSHV